MKRLFDIILSLALGAILIIPIIIIALSVFVTSRDSVIFWSERVGQGNRIFKMPKFRTMRVGTPTVATHLLVDPQAVLTPIGSFLRLSSLDEIPQLFNVLFGEMSLVGPRPLPIRDVEHFDAWHHIRHQVMPGITGLWQISGRSDIGDFNDVARLDLYYIDNWSLNLDLDILVETARLILFGKGAY